MVTKHMLLYEPARKPQMLKYKSKYDAERVPSFSRNWPICKRTMKFQFFNIHLPDIPRK
jgi:hypothetical protein